MNGGGVAVAALCALGLISAFGCSKRRESAPSAPARPSPAISARTVRAPVHFGADEGREALFRRRFADDVRAEFTDASLLRALGGPEAGAAPPVFVEAWIVNRSGADLPVFAKAPEIELGDGRRLPTRPLSAFVAEPLTPRAKLLSDAFGPRANEPLGNGRLRRVVYALPQGIAWVDVVSVNVDGLKLRQGTAAVDALEEWTADCGPPLRSLVSELPGRAAELAPAPVGTEPPR